MHSACMKMHTSGSMCSRATRIPAPHVCNNISWRFACSMQRTHAARNWPVFVSRKSAQERWVQTCGHFQVPTKQIAQVPSKWPCMQLVRLVDLNHQRRACKVIYTHIAMYDYHCSWCTIGCDYYIHTAMFIAIDVLYMYRLWPYIPMLSRSIGRSFIHGFTINQFRKKIQRGYVKWLIESLCSFSVIAWIQF